MPKITLLQNPEVAELVNKRVAQAEAKAAKDSTRHYKSILRSVKEAISSSGIDKKAVKGLTAHVVAAIAEHAPPQAAE